MELKTLSVLYTFCMYAMVCHAGYLQDITCPESDNPFKLAFTVQKEVLRNGTSVDPDPITIGHIAVMDIPCDKNYNRELAKDLRLKCDLEPSQITCDLHPECIEARNAALEDLLDTTIYNMESFIKVKGISFFKDNPIARKIIFGVDRLSDLNGEQIFKSLTNVTQANLFDGFSISDGTPIPTVQQFTDEFSETLGYYEDLHKIRNTTGISGGLEKLCVLTKRTYPELTLEEARLECTKVLFEAIDKRAEKDENYAFLGKAMDHLIRSLTNNKKSYPGVKLPLWRESCVEEETELSQQDNQVDDKGGK